MQYNTINCTVEMWTTETSNKEPCVGRKVRLRPLLIFPHVPRQCFGYILTQRLITVACIMSFVLSKFR